MMYKRIKKNVAYIALLYIVCIYYSYKWSLKDDIAKNRESSKKLVLFGRCIEY